MFLQFCFCRAICIVCIFLTILPPSSSFVTWLNPIWKANLFKLNQQIDGGSFYELSNGERKFVTLDKENTIIVTKLNGRVYAVNSKCPHQGTLCVQFLNYFIFYFLCCIERQMKRGRIEETIEEGPTITCNFHNSKFSLENGECKDWCPRCFYIPGTEFIAQATAKSGGPEWSSAKVYPVEIVEGRIVIHV